MTLQDLGSLGELVGAVATVATLFYLATQVRASMLATRASSAQTVHESFSTWYRMLASDADLSELMAKGLRDYAALSETERAQFVSTAMSLLLCGQDAFIKWREGSLSPDLWSGWELVMMNLVNAPGGRAFWQDRSYLFGSDFRDHLENDVMRREPHPNAKPLGAFSIAADQMDRSDA